jgi:hypothetical protein
MKKKIKVKNNKSKSNKSKSNKNKTRIQSYSLHSDMKNKSKKKLKMSGGNNPFSDIFGMWDTMTYNLSDAVSVFTITPPSSHMNPSDKVINPSPSKQFI